MDVIAVDDSVQKKPSRAGMGRLVAVGGLHVPSANVKWLERELDQLCQRSGFPAGSEFKWSPHKKTWMHKHLRGTDRSTFFQWVLYLAGQAGAKAWVVIEDSTKGRADSASRSAEEDVIRLFLERAHSHLGQCQAEAIVIADHPSGGRPAEARFLGSCIETLREGTDYVTPERIALVVTADSAHVRLVQLADVITGCTVSYVGGETGYAPPLFNSHIKPLLRKDFGRIGGAGVKIQPDLRYGNLYYWLFGDSHLGMMHGGIPLPTSGRAYADSPDTP